MSEIIVTDKETGEEVFRYQAAAPIEWNGMEFATHTHAVHSVSDDQMPSLPIIRMTWTQTQWKRRFTQEERLAIRQASESNARLADYMDLMNGAEEIANDDPDTVAALNLLEQVGLIGEGRAQEILNG